MDGKFADNSLQITAKTAKRGRKRGRPFVKGQSGNPAGRPRGSVNRGTRAAAVLLDGEAENLARKAVELALDGGGGLYRAVRRSSTRMAGSFGQISNVIRSSSSPAFTTRVTP